MSGSAAFRDDGQPARADRLALTVGFLAFAVALLAAAGDQATGYELSIYAATTPVFWAGIAVALLVGVAVALREVGGPQRLGVGLAATSLFAVVALPVVRGYYFYGVADPLTHLGMARELGRSNLAPTDMIYPGVHSIAVFLNQLGGAPMRRALLLGTFSFVLVYVVFVALTVEELAPDGRYALAVGGLSALLLLPINHISMHLRTHPFSQTTMFAAFVLFALSAYVTRVDAGVVRGLFTAEGAVLSVAAVASILLHPQVAADLLVVFLAASALQLLGWSRLLGRVDLDGHAPLFAPTAIFAVAYAAWAIPSEWFVPAIQRHSVALVALLQGRPPAVGDRIASQSASLLAIGASPAEIFLKLFVPTTVYLVLAGAFSLALLLGRVRESEETATNAYVVAGAAVAALFILVYFASSVAEMYFRHLGLLMLFVTVLGAVALARRLSAGGVSRAPRRRTVAVALVIVLLLPLTAAVAFQSPYIHKANQHITEQSAAGYQTTFEMQAEGYPVVSVRGVSERYHESLYGPEAAGPPLSPVEGRELQSLRSTYGDGAYLVLTEHAIQREVRAYEELRYTREQFAAVRAQPGVSRVSSTGEARVYFVPDT